MVSAVVPRHARLVALMAAALQTDAMGWNGHAMAELRPALLTVLAMSMVFSSNQADHRRQVVDQGVVACSLILAALVATALSTPCCDIHKTWDAPLERLGCVPAVRGCAEQQVP